MRWAARAGGGGTRGLPRAGRPAQRVRAAGDGGSVRRHARPQGGSWSRKKLRLRAGGANGRCEGGRGVGVGVGLGVLGGACSLEGVDLVARGVGEAHPEGADACLSL